MDVGGYVTDGHQLYEVVGVRVEAGRKAQPNFGVMGGRTKPAPDKRFYTLSNCSSGYVMDAMGEEEFEKCFKPVVPDVEHAIAALHSDLERWGNGAPEWAR